MINKNNKRSATKGENKVKLPVSCSQCKTLRWFASEHFLKLHQRAKHPNQSETALATSAITPPRAFECSKCPKRLQSKIHLDQHLEFHRNERHRTCKVCSKTFKTAYSAQRHQKIAHPIQSPGSNRPSKTEGLPTTDKAFNPHDKKAEAKPTNQLRASNLRFSQVTHDDQCTKYCFQPADNDSEERIDHDPQGSIGVLIAKVLRLHYETSATFNFDLQVDARCYKIHDKLSVVARKILGPINESLKSRTLEIRYPYDINFAVQQAVKDVLESPQRQATKSSPFIIEVLSMVIKVQDDALSSRGCIWHKLPQCAIESKSVLDIKSNEKVPCILWGVAASLALSKEKPFGIKRWMEDPLVYRDEVEKLDRQAVWLPFHLEDCEQLEDENNLAIFIYQHHGHLLMPLRVSPYTAKEIEEQGRHVVLLYHYNGHYYLITSLPRLYNRLNPTHRSYFCLNCLQQFRLLRLLHKHQEICQENLSHRINHRTNMQSRLCGTYSNLGGPPTCSERYVVYTDIESSVLKYKVLDPKATQMRAALRGQCRNLFKALTEIGLASQNESSFRPSHEEMDNKLSPKDLERDEAYAWALLKYSEDKTMQQVVKYKLYKGTGDHKDVVAEFVKDMRELAKWIDDRMAKDQCKL